MKNIAVASHKKKKNAKIYKMRKQEASGKPCRKTK